MAHGSRRHLALLWRFAIVRRALGLMGCFIAGICARRCMSARHFYTRPPPFMFSLAQGRRRRPSPHLRFRGNTSGVGASGWPYGGMRADRNPRYAAAHQNRPSRPRYTPVFPLMWRLAQGRRSRPISFGGFVVIRGVLGVEANCMPYGGNRGGTIDPEPRRTPQYF